MQPSDIFNSLLITVAGAIASIVAGLILPLLERRLRRRRAKDEADIEEIATSVRDEQALVVRSMKALENAASKKDVSEAINSLKESIDTISSHEKSSSAVESLVAGYHEQALSQAQAQFWFSVVAASVGFALIIISAFSIDISNLSTVLKILPGVTMDAVAFLFFRQAAETRQRATDLYDRLRRDKNIADSLELVTSIEDVRVRSAAKAQIALHMAGLEPTAIDLTRFLSTSDDHGEGTKAESAMPKQ